MSLNIIITGASRGIGKAIAEEFAKSIDCMLFLISKEQPIVLEVKAKYKTYHCDLRRKEEIEAVIKEIINESEYIDVLVNNAGIVRDRTLLKMSYEEWQDVIDTNLNSVFFVTKNVLPYMRSGGCIINITSVVGITGNFGQTNYAASKAGLIGFTKSLAKEVAKKNIRVVAIAPGFVETDMYRQLPEDIKQQILMKIPLGRVGKPEEIAKFVRFIALEGTYCTGQVYVVDGGISQSFGGG